ncbi:hypothetical protein [Planococcus koreensis]
MLQEGLELGSQNVYGLTAVFALISLLLIFGLPRKRGLKSDG